MKDHKHQIIAALKRKRVMALFEAALITNYCHFYPDRQKDVVNMIKQAIHLLQQSQEKGDDPVKLGKAVRLINKKIFRKNDRSFWFNRGHRAYKINKRSKVDFEFIQKEIIGNRILDFGSNGGYFALELDKHGYDIMTTDVLDYRDRNARHLLFRKMKSTVDIPYGPDSADTAIVKTVFHHIESKHLPTVLANLRQIATRLIVKEDIYGVSKSTAGLTGILKRQKLLREYVSLSKKDQYHFLVIIDFFGNAIAHGMTKMNLTFNFYTLSEWRRIMHRSGYRINKVRYYGFEKTKLHGSLQAWLICDRKK